MSSSTVSSSGTVSEQQQTDKVHLEYSNDGIALLRLAPSGTKVVTLTEERLRGRCGGHVSRGRCGGHVSHSRIAPLTA